jgi:hypothetical protein
MLRKENAMSGGKQNKPKSVETTISERHHAITTDFTEGEESRSDLDRTSRGTEKSRSKTPSDIDQLSDEANEPIDQIYRKGVVSGRDLDLEESDDDIAQDPVDGTLPRE